MVVGLQSGQPVQGQQLNPRELKLDLELHPEDLLWKYLPPYRAYAWMNCVAIEETSCLLMLFLRAMPISKSHRWFLLVILLSFLVVWKVAIDPGSAQAITWEPTGQNLCNVLYRGLCREVGEQLICKAKVLPLHSIYAIWSLRMPTIKSISVFATYFTMGNVVTALCTGDRFNWCCLFCLCWVCREWWSWYCLS